MDKFELQKEKDHLKGVCKFLNDKIKMMSQTIFSSKERIQEFRKYVWENKGDMDVQELTSVRTNSEMEAKRMLDERDYYRRLLKIESSPYFASIQFMDDVGVKHDIYIGMTYLKKDELHQIIYDWRAPVCSLFYDYETGPAHYLAPEGEVYGELLRKRQYKIESQKLIRVFDNSLNINDDVLQEVLAENSNEKMKNIVNTIQQEQNQVIRNIRDKNLIVQGIAGSGKTSVALHRIAFLLYKIPNLTSEKVLIFSPNQIFTEYISNVLPELGEENTVQTTFHDYLSKIIIEYKEVESFIHFLSRYYQDDNTSYEEVCYKQSEKIILDIEAYVHHLEENTFFERGFVENHVFEYSKEELDYLFHDRFSSLSFFERIQAMALKMSENNYNGKRHKQATYRKLLFECLPVKRDFKQILIDFYESDYCDINISSDEIRKLKSNRFISYEDALVFVYLKGLLSEFPYDKYMEQVVIDEAQDYNYLQYKILSKIFKKAHFTILGDIHQNINPYYAYDSLERLNDLWPSRYIELTKTYRSSEEIISFTNKILHLNHVSAIRKKNANPVLVHGYDKLISDIEYLNAKYKNVAIVTKDEKTASVLYEQLKDEFRMSFVNAFTTDFQKDLLILPAYLAKGLEFDSVIVYQDEDSYYDEKSQNLFYVACTRAQHELVVLEKDA